MQHCQGLKAEGMLPSGLKQARQSNKFLLRRLNRLI